MTGEEGFDSRRRRTVLTTLSITQTIGYGILLYSYAVLLEPMTRDLSSSPAVVTGAYTASVLTGAVVAVPFGRWLDRHGGRALMTTGSVGGALLLLAWSRVETVAQLYVVQCGIGIVGAATLYDAAIPVVVSWYGTRTRPRALLTVTVAAGFASTIFLPLSGWLVERHGWRTSLVVLGLLYASTIPLHTLVRRPHRRIGTAGPQAAPAPGRSVALRDRAFWLIAVGLTLETGAVNAFNVHIVSALGQWGHSPAFSAGIAGLLGVFSVAGRLVTTGLRRWCATAMLTAAVFCLQALAAFLLPVIATSPFGAIGAVIGFGIGAGVGTIAKPILLSERYGSQDYGTLAGMVAIPMTLAKAGAPLAASFINSSTGGYQLALVSIGACCMLAAAALTATGTPRTIPALRG
ncbi:MULTISPECIES: MFS transporter [unclassified Micromonospora]|uniref:MFS transporter n=1 Tax=unclassified Micromonospora TaxID=2617518 RepID=UPI0022B6B243|nr:MULTISPECIES: MFS transporter [unclassified Micromonospora]MCZ7472978.1 MFS transporter [Micromonospora sp. WMMC273]WBC03659.1 MFS transporter [Micromonospora sp. WMMA1976]